MDKKVERGEKLLGMGFSFKTVMQVIDLDGVTYEEELERIAQQIEDGIVPYRGALLKPALPSGDASRLPEESQSELFSEYLSQLTSRKVASRVAKANPADSVASAQRSNSPLSEPFHKNGDHSQDGRS